MSFAFSPFLSLDLLLLKPRWESAAVTGLDMAGMECCPESRKSPVSAHTATQTEFRFRCQ